MKRILIITGGGKKHLEPFRKYGKEFRARVSIASFSDVSYETKGDSAKVKVNKIDAKNFDVIYFRLVGRRLEDAALLADYITSHNI